MDFEEAFSALPQEAQRALSDPQLATRIANCWVPIQSLGVSERIFVSFKLEGSPSLEEEFGNIETNFEEPVVPFAVDLGANYFCVQQDGRVTYFDFAGAYGPPSLEPDDDCMEPTSFVVAESMPEFLESLQNDFRPEEGSRAALLQWLQESSGGPASADECWIFQGSSAKRIKRETFTTFREHFYYAESPAEEP